MICHFDQSPELLQQLLRESPVELPFTLLEAQVKVFGCDDDQNKLETVALHAGIQAANYALPSGPMPWLRHRTRYWKRKRELKRFVLNLVEQRTNAAFGVGA